MSWRLVQPAQNNISEWTGRRQTIASGRGWWECDYGLPPIVGDSAIREWRAFVAKARGAANDFRVPVHPTAQYSLSVTSETLVLDFADMLYLSEGGAASLTAFVAGASQTGRSLTTDGWPASETVLEAGQFVTIGDQLLQLTEDVVSNASGAATITFEPALRASPADNAPIEYGNPYCLMYLDETPAISSGTGQVHSLSLKLRESF
jgi:hypothetical protein